MRLLWLVIIHIYSIDCLIIPFLCVFSIKYKDVLLKKRACPYYVWVHAGPTIWGSQAWYANLRSLFSTTSLPLVDEHCLVVYVGWFGLTPVFNNFQLIYTGGLVFVGLLPVQNQSLQKPTSSPLTPCYSSFTTCGIHFFPCCSWQKSRKSGSTLALLLALEATRQRSFDPIKTCPNYSRLAAFENSG